MNWPVLLLQKKYVPYMRWGAFFTIFASIISYVLILLCVLAGHGYEGQSERMIKESINILTVGLSFSTSQSQAKRPTTSLGQHNKAKQPFHHKPWHPSMVPYYLAHSTMVLYAVHTHSDMIGHGFVLKGGLVMRCAS
jgi:hypothetical protein